MVTLRPWGADDRWLLDRTNAPEMTAFLGGPETEQQLDGRHRRYQETRPGGVFVLLDDDGLVVGSIGFWEHTEAGRTVWEAGWSVLPEHQRRGHARAALEEVVRLAAAAATHEELHAYPSVENLASNALCASAGFTLVGPRAFEYPKGHWMTCNDWVHIL